MSEVLDELRNSSDLLEKHLAKVLEHWQDKKRENGEPASLGYEPRDFRRHGAIGLISSRVLNSSSGFEEVDSDLSYEAIVVKFSNEFESTVVEAANERLKLGNSLALQFEEQEIKFFLKTSSITLFNTTNILPSAKDWTGKHVKIPPIAKDAQYAEKWLARKFRALVWLHETKVEDERGRGLTAIIECSPIDNEGVSQILDVEFFDKPIGEELLNIEKNRNDFIQKIAGYRHTRIWPISNANVDILLTHVRKKVHLIATYNDHAPNPNDQINLEPIVESTSLREVVLRKYQGVFRNSLLSQRPNTCAITGTSELSVLEAAHIIPYSERFADRDKPENGLLLRRDIHKLFDGHKISINPTSRLVEIEKSLVSPDYMKLAGIKVSDAISQVSLEHHYNIFSSKQL